MKPIQNKKCIRSGNNSGFTLVETAISLLILGILMAPLIGQYNLYKTKKVERMTKERLYKIVQTIETYKENFGAYPCPSSFSAASGAAYGGAADCTDTTTVSAGSCATGGAYCIQSSPNTALPAADRRIRIGALPFRALALSEDETYDSYGSRFVYAVTENLANPLKFDEHKGGISVKDDNGTSLSNPPDSIHMLVFSLGKNRAGAFNRSGNQVISCSGGIDVENCDFLTAASSASFITTFISESNNSTNQDDLFLYQAPDFGLRAGGWRNGITSNGEDSNDLLLVNKRLSIGVLTPPTEYLTVNGSILAESGNIMASSFCDANNANCFKPTDLTRTCPSGQFVTGFAKASATATTSVSCSRIYYGCSAGLVLAGKNADGTAICVSKPTPLPEPDPDTPDPDTPDTDIPDPNTVDPDPVTPDPDTPDPDPPTPVCQATIVTTESCGAYAQSGSVQVTRTLISGSIPCAYTTSSTSTCTCIASTTETSEPTCAASDTSNVCVAKTYNYPLDTDKKCTLRTLNGTPSSGSCKSATFTANSTGKKISPSPSKTSFGLTTCGSTSPSCKTSGESSSCQTSGPSGYQSFAATCVKTNETCHYP